MVRPFIKGFADRPPNAGITLQQFRVVGHASAAVDKLRRIEQGSDASAKGMRRALLKNRSGLSAEAATDLGTLIARMATLRIARACPHVEQQRETLERTQINAAFGLLQYCCTCVTRSKVAPMKEFGDFVRLRPIAVVAWARMRQANGFLEAPSRLFQAVKQGTRGFTRLLTIRTVNVLIDGKRDLRVIKPHASLPN